MNTSRLLLWQWPSEVTWRSHFCWLFSLSDLFYFGASCVWVDSTTRGNICTGCYRQRRGAEATRRAVCTTLDARLSWQHCGLPLWYAAFFPGLLTHTQPGERAAVSPHLPPPLCLWHFSLLHSSQRHQHTLKSETLTLTWSSKAKKSRSTSHKACLEVWSHQPGKETPCFRFRNVMTHGQKNDLTISKHSASVL